jgi:hypothetical protein
MGRPAKQAARELFVLLLVCIGLAVLGWSEVLSKTAGMAVGSVSAVLWLMWARP